MKKLQLFETIFPAQTTSIEFNGVDEEMGDATFQTLGFGNTWSFMVWMRRRGDAVGLNNAMSIFVIVEAAGKDLILLQSLGNQANDPIRMVTRDSAGAVLKDFRFNLPLFPFDSWRQVIFTWDGTTLTAYDNGAAVAATTKTVDGSGTMADSARKIVICNNPSGGTQDYSGFLHSIAFWNADVSSAVTEIYNGGVASTFDLSKASFAADLQHWWRLGQDATDIGKDSGIGSPLIDVDENSANITAADIVSESPA